MRALFEFGEGTSPELSLVGAILHAALRDAASRAKTGEAEKCRQDAMEFWSDRDGALSFWCDLLKLDSAHVKRLARRAIERKNGAAVVVDDE